MKKYLNACVRARRLGVSATRVSAGCALALLIAGCGSGSSGTVTPTNPSGGGGNGGSTTSSTNQLAGTIADVNGSPIVGASVNGAGNSATSTQEGDYVFPAVTVPAGSNSIVVPITATANINGTQWSGKNVVEVFNGLGPTSNAHVTLSPTSQQATATGTVTDTSGVPLAGARVFIAPGPVSDTSGNVYFTNLSSFVSYTDSNGHFNIPTLPTVTADGKAQPEIYTATASFAGHINQTQSNITFTAGQTTTLNFSLQPTSTGSTIGAVQALNASMFTIPSVPNRGAGVAAELQAYQSIKQFMLQKQGISFSTRHAALPSKVSLQYAKSRAAGRATPAGSIVEGDIFWNYQQISNLLGFDILRSDGDNAHFFSEALLRDPLADRYADVDPALTPDTVYFYNVAPLDTVLFPANGTEGTALASSTMQVSPLDPETLIAPAAGAQTSSSPVLSWASVANAGGYTVNVYSQYPGYQSTTDGVAPIISQAVNAPSTSYALTSTLSPGTYYWDVIAQYTPPTTSPTVGYSYSVSPISSFVVP